jgi:anti-sigma B factor antagonist
METGGEGVVSGRCGALWRWLFKSGIPADSATFRIKSDPASPPAVAAAAATPVSAPDDAGKQPSMVSTDLYRVSREGSVNVVDLTLPHALDIQEFDRLNESILGLIRRELEGAWVLDLSRLSYMGSAALGLLVNLRQQIKQSGGRLVLCGLSPQLMHIFKTCCMERLFKIVKTREDAVAAAAW